jgi:hypothetical protein
MLMCTDTSLDPIEIRQDVSKMHAFRLAA